MSESSIQIRLKSRPVGLPKESDFETVCEPVREPGPGQILLQTLFLSLDPAMRGWMSDAKSYLPPVGIGEVMRGAAVGRVLRSNDPSLAAGDLVSGFTGWQQYVTVRAKHLQKLLPGVTPEMALSSLGLTGLTAYFGLLDVGRPKAGETVVVSGAAGAVGSVAGQIAKLKGCRVVGTAGSDAKCAWITGELGFDAALNYRKSQNLAADLGRLCPEGVDIYFDNVGGPMLEAVLTHLKPHARVILCGAISQYNSTEPVRGPSNWFSLIVNRVRVEGFILIDYEKRFAEAVQEMAPWAISGKINSRVDIVDGIENAPKALLRLFSGENTGKQLVRVGA